MAITNHERVGKALELLKDGPRAVRRARVQEPYQATGWPTRRRRYFGDDRIGCGKKPIAEWDVAGAAQADVGDVERRLSARRSARPSAASCSELRDCRNKWAHQEPFSSDDAYRALDSMARLLTAVSAPQADEVDKMKMELRRLVFDEQVRSEKRKAGGTLIESHGDRQPQALARGGDAAQGRGQRPLSAGRVRRRPVAGASGRRHRRIHATRSSSSAAPT